MSAAPPVAAYAVLGGVLRSALPFPELPPADAASAPTWTLRVGEGEPPSRPLVCLGERRVGSERLALWRTPDGLRLAYSHAGVFDLATDGAEVVWYGSADAAPELVRAMVLGPVLALAMEARGCLCLHGSAVAVDGRAIVFLGPKHFGKSTLATALVAGGACLVGDDVVAVQPGPPPRVRPGVASVRLWADAARRLRVDTLCDTVIPGIKTTALAFGGRACQAEDTPLAALYLLEPVPPGRAGAPVRRAPLVRTAAAVALAHQTKLSDALVGLAGAGRQLRAAAAVAATTPVFTLRVERDFDALPAVVERLLAWHGAPSAETVQHRPRFEVGPFPIPSPLRALP